jgi:hypothetical protein
MWASSAPGAAVAVALTALVAGSFAERWLLLTASPFPLGVDGYFYPLQLRALLAHGHLAYPTSPVAFYLLAPFALATDPITGAKLGAAVYGAAVALPAYVLGARLGACRGAGVAAAVLATTSVGSTYLTVEFVKNGVGLTVALTALCGVLRATDAPTRRRLAAAVIGLVAAWATHKMAAAIVLVIALPAALAAAPWPRRRLVIAAVTVAGLALAVGAVFPQRFLAPGDAALLTSLGSATPHWTAPALALPTGDLALGHDALLGLVLGVVAIAARCLRTRPANEPATTRPARAASWPILVVAIAVGLPFLAITDRQGLGFRLRLAAFVPTALTAAIVARELLGGYRHRSTVLAALAVVLALVRRPTTDLDPIITHPALVTAAQALAGHVPPTTTLIIPERHLVFLIAWYTGAPTALRPDGIAADHRMRVLPLHFIGAGSALDRALIAARAEPSLRPPLGVHPRHPNGLVLVDEATWRWLLDRLPPGERAQFAAWPTI